MDNTEYIYKEQKTEYRSVIKNTVAATLIGLVVVALVVYGIYFSVKSHKQEIVLQNYAEQSFVNMIEYVNSAEDCLFMAMVSASHCQTTNYLSEARRYTMMAEEDLVNLPIDESAQENVSRYLVTLSDVAGACSRKLSSGDELSEEENSMLESLCGYCRDLSGALCGIHEELSAGKCTWNELTKKSKNITHDKVLADQNASLKRFSDPFTNFPELEYDGKFSSHICKIQPRGLSGKEFSRTEAEDAVRKLFSQVRKEYSEIRYEGNHMVNNMEVLCFTILQPENKEFLANVDITKQGGFLCTFMSVGENGQATIDTTEAEEKGREFLEENGYENMEVLSGIRQGNEYTASYVYVKDGVYYYPDTCNVKISLVTGNIIGFDGHNYLCCHEGRYLEKPAFSIEEGMEKISKKVRVEESREAVIMTEYKTEKHVFEYKCSAMGRDVYVYVDTQTGEIAECRC